MDAYRLSAHSLVEKKEIVPKFLWRGHAGGFMQGSLHPPTPTKFLYHILKLSLQHPGLQPTQ